MLWNQTTVRVAALFALVSAIALSPAAAWAEEELVDNPQYQSWSGHKPGTTVTSDMQTAMGGFNMTMEMTQKLASINEKEAVVEITTKMTGPGVPPGAGQPPAQKQTIKAKVSKAEAERSKLPPGMTGEMKEVSSEKIEAAGKSYDCKVVEFSGKNEMGDMKGKIWNTQEIPGAVAKMESTGEASGQAMKITLTVKSIEEGK